MSLLNLFRRRSTQHAITITSEGGGTTTPSVTTAAKGEMVFLNSVPDSYKELKEYVVTSGNINIINNCFEMPDTAVSIKAVYTDRCFSAVKPASLTIFASAVDELQAITIPSYTNPQSHKMVVVDDQIKITAYLRDGTTQQLTPVVDDGELHIIESVPNAIRIKAEFFGLKHGDVDNDNYITVNDSVQISQQVVGLRTFNDKQKFYADTDNDGQVTINDATRISKYIVGDADDYYNPK